MITLIKGLINITGDGDVSNIMSVLEESNREREELRQKCHELEIQVKLLTENKSIMTTELDNLQAQVKGKIETESYRYDFPYFTYFFKFDP